MREIVMFDANETIRKLIEDDSFKSLVDTIIKKLNPSK